MPYAQASRGIPLSRSLDGLRRGGVSSYKKPLSRSIRPKLLKARFYRMLARRFNLDRLLATCPDDGKTLRCLLSAAIRCH